MAEGLARHMFGERAVVASAGSAATSVNPRAIAALRDVGIDISSQWSKSIVDVNPGVFDVIVTLCGEEVCPVVPGRVERLHWPLPDPAMAPLTEQPARFRAIRDDIRRRLDTFGRERGLLADPPSSA